MTTNNPTSTNSTWTGMVPVDDTALAVTDTGGPGIPVVFLNGQFATQGYWRHVIADLGTGWRHITYDERARGRKSGRSADYSFEAAVRDVDAVLAARGVDRAVLVGWSYGAVVGAHWAHRNPHRTIGAVLVDGAFPYDWLDEAMEQRIRKMFRRMNMFMPLLRPTGLTPRMNAEQMAESNIERDGSPANVNWARCWTPSPSRCGTWSPRGRPSAARATSRNASGPASTR
ncbi:alpha/beta fold hydrolase [Micromonospora lupini]|uniref:alpha/beta fold hydrolase n=1 Tax=Micromonospora lupini TaxID=285679 RepID=UPI0031CF209F